LKKGKGQVATIERREERTFEKRDWDKRTFGKRDWDRKTKPLKKGGWTKKENL